jgi:hypothetical protein
VTRLLKIWARSLPQQKFANRCRECIAKPASSGLWNWKENSVVWLSGAVKRPLSAKQTQPPLHHKDIICIHTMVGYLTSTETMFDEGGYTGTESHFGIGGIWGPDKDKGYDGRVEQFQDTDYTADANYKGSWHVISIECADNAPKLPSQIVALTPKQVDSVVNLIVELCRLYDIPPVLIPDTKPTRRGLAYHFQGAPANLVPGGELWTAAGHECPGPVRIKQFKEVIIPRVRAALRPIKPQVVETDMQWNDKIKLTAYEAKVWGSPYKEGDEVSIGLMIQYPTLARRLEKEFLDFKKEVETKLDAIQASLALLVPKEPS